MGEHGGAAACRRPGDGAPLLRHGRGPGCGVGHLRRRHRVGSVPALVGGRGGRDRHLRLARHRRTRTRHGVARVRDRGGAGLGRRRFVCRNERRRYRGDCAGSRECHRLEQAADRPRVACCHPHLLAPATARRRRAGCGARRGDGARACHRIDGARCGDGADPPRGGCGADHPATACTSGSARHASPGLPT